MKKISLYLLIAGLSILLSFDSLPLVRKKIADGITALLPKDFRPMDDTDLVGRYPSVRQPLGAFTNNDHTADFSVNISASQWPDQNFELAQQFFRSSIENMFDRVDMIDQGIHTVNGRKFIYFEFEYKISGDEKVLGEDEAVLNYTCIEYLIGPRSALVASFNCPRQLRLEWEETAHTIMNSIRIKM